MALSNVNKMMLETSRHKQTVDPLALMSNVSPQHYHSQSSTNPPTTYHQPHSADTSQSDLGLSPTDNLIENLTNTLALLNPHGRVVVQNVQGRQNRGQGNNAWGVGAVGYGRAHNRVGNANPVKARQVKCSYRTATGVGHIARNCTQPKHPQNSEYFKDKMLHRCKSQRMGVVLDEGAVIVLAVVEGQSDDCDAYDSDVDEAPTAQTMFMANLSSADPVCNEAGPSYDSDVLSEYVKDNRCEVVQNNASMLLYDCQNNASMVPNDAYVMIDNDEHESDVLSVSHTPWNTVANNSLNAELATYKEQVELYERHARFELTEREQKIDEQLRIVICDRNIKEENLKKELHSIKLQLASTIQHNKLMVDEVTSLKKDFNQKENKYLEEFLDLKALKDKVEDKLFKQGQSIQTVHMMCKPRSYYDEVNKVAIGYKNPLCLHRT
ncbi:hypothetical protein Tco_0668792 [Tanacetum coccineum]